MPLDTSSYSLALLRLDGRRWNELRRIDGQISTQAAADGSSYFEMGNTKVICTVSGPEESRRTGGAGGADSEHAQVQVEINIAGFSGVERKRRGRSDKRTAEMAHAIAAALTDTLFTQLYPRSTIGVTLHVLSQDGALLAACVNAATLALVDAGVPMADYVAACTAGSAAAHAANDAAADPLLDLNGLEEQELPFLTVATLGASQRVVLLLLETRVQSDRVEAMLAVAVDGCRQVKLLLDKVVRAHGKKVMALNG